MLAQVVVSFYGRPLGESEKMTLQAGQHVWVNWATNRDYVCVYPGNVRYIGGWERADDGRKRSKPMLTLTLAQAKAWLKSYPETARKAPDRPAVYKGELPTTEA